MKTQKLLFAIAIALSIVPVTMGEEPADGGKQKRTRAQLRMAVQEICPVTGQKLGSHGEPIEVKIGKEKIFLCCKGCTTGKVNPKHWSTIHSNFAKAQGICPVMKGKLPKKAKWTIVQGQIVYVCCPPCIKKIEADPEAYLKQVDQLFLTSLKQRKQRS